MICDDSESERINLISGVYDKNEIFKNEMKLLPSCSWQALVFAQLATGKVVVR